MFREHAESDTVVSVLPPKRKVEVMRVIYAEESAPKSARGGRRTVDVFNREALPHACRMEGLRAIAALTGGSIDESTMTVWKAGTAALPNSEWAAITARYGFLPTKFWTDSVGEWVRVEKEED